MNDFPGSNMSNYQSAYETWNDAEEKICPECKGTGLDRDEIFDCENCFGEGFIVPLDSALDPVVGS